MFLSFWYSKEKVEKPTLTVDYNGMESMDENSYSRLGSYEFIGNMKSDGSLIFAHLTKNAGRSVILRDWEGDNNWIGTVMISLLQYVLIKILIPSTNKIMIPMIILIGKEQAVLALFG